MSYTVEDFARARFAVMETEEAGEVLLTRDPDPGVKYRWLTANGGAFTDAEMAEGRCYPVVEADLVMQRQAQAWLEVLDHLAMTNLGRGTGIEGVKRRLDELQDSQQPADVDPMEYLAGLWERAELTEDAPQRLGDLVIFKVGDGDYELFHAKGSRHLAVSPACRVITRFRKRSAKAEALERILEDAPFETDESPGALADYLASRGVRVVEL
jgi:hypothetical protein